MKANVIVDNIGNEKAKGEWGLCIYIEYNGIKILLDTGASGLFVQNARVMNIPLEDVDYAVLSHAHYDHSDGMKEFFDVNKNAKFLLRDACGENCYGKKWFFSKYIGIPKGILKNYKERIELVNGNYTIMDGAYLLPHTTPELEKIGKKENMYIKEAAGWRPDNFAHEQSLVFKTPKGLVIFNSCCHGGAANIIREAAAAFPDQQVYALIGGFHLFNKSEAFVRNLANSIKETGIQHVYTGHCTGKRSYQILKEELGKIVEQLKVGLVIEL